MARTDSISLKPSEHETSQRPPSLGGKDAGSSTQPAREASAGAASEIVEPVVRGQPAPPDGGMPLGEDALSVEHTQMLSSREQTIEHVIQDYLQEQKRNHRRPGTLEWHQQTLWLFQHYLHTEHHCIRLNQVTSAQVTGWLAWLPLVPNPTGGAVSRSRSANTVHSYARSARAFCQWAVCHQWMPATPFAHLPLPPQDPRQLPHLEVEEWEQLLRACRSLQESGLLCASPRPTPDETDAP